MDRLPGLPPSNGTVRRQVSVPSSARAFSTLSHMSYADAFLLDTGPTHDRTGEQWARAILEGAPAPTRAAAISAWSALGLRLGSARSDQHVLGWELRRSAADFALLAASSPIGLLAQVLFKRGRETLLLATFVELKNPGARALWAGVAPAHRQGGALPPRPGRRPSAGRSPKLARRVTRNQNAAGNRAARSSSSTCAVLIT
jgi:hypothetical protein